MKIVIFGANGTIGSKVAEALKGHEIIKVARSNGDVQADLSNPASIKEAFDKIGPFDALVSAAGEVAFAPLKDLTPAQWETSYRSKLLGQINLVLIGMNYINEGGSFTLVSGVLSDEFIKAGTVATTVNRAIEGFVQASSLELGRGLRINVISPNLLEESLAAYGDFFPGHTTVAGSKVAQAYTKSILGIETGRIYKVQ